jgi:hypothetical protein
MWGSYKMDVVIRKGGRVFLLWKLIGKKIVIKKEVMK